MALTIVAVKVRLVHGDLRVRIIHVELETQYQ